MRVNDSCFRSSNVGVNKILRTANKSSANVTNFLLLLRRLNH